MTSRGLLNIILAIALAGLIALAVYEPGKNASQDVKKLTLVDPQAVQKIRIERDENPPLLLTKNSGQWRMQAPLAHAANAGRIERLLKVLQAKSIASYSMSQVDTKQLQINASSLLLQFDGTSLRFGATDALGGSRYVQVKDSVHLITDRYSHLAKGVATDFIDPKLLPDGSVISELNLPELHLINQDGHWLAGKKKVDADAVQKLLDEWRYGRALRVTELAENVTPIKESEFISITVGNSDNKKIIRFALLRTETEIILQRQKLGIQYHFPLEVSQRLLSLSDNSALPAQ